MNIEEFRDYCLSLSKVTEKMPFAQFHGANTILVFYIAGKSFCYVNIDKFDSCMYRQMDLCLWLLLGTFSELVINAFCLVRSSRCLSLPIRGTPRLYQNIHSLPTI